MAEQDKPFICYKSGWNLRIVPRGGEGWRALALWLVPFLAVTAMFVWTVAAHPQPALVKGLTIIFVLASLIWAIALIRWSYVRSEVIDMKELLRLKQQLEQKQRSGR